MGALAARNVPDAASPDAIVASSIAVVSVLRRMDAASGLCSMSSAPSDVASEVSPVSVSISGSDANVGGAAASNDDVDAVAEEEQRSETPSAFALIAEQGGTQDLQCLSNNPLLVAKIDDAITRLQKVRLWASLTKVEQLDAMWNSGARDEFVLLSLQRQVKQTFKEISDLNATLDSYVECIAEASKEATDALRGVTTGLDGLVQ